MEYDNEIKKMEELKQLINNCHDSSKKILLISDYINLIAYLYELDIVDGEKFVDNLGSDFDLYDKEMDKKKKSYCDSYLKNMDLIIIITNKLMKLYERYPIHVNKFTYGSDIDLKEGLAFLKDFFCSLGDDFYTLYRKMMDENRISLRKGLMAAGKTYNVSYSDASYITLDDQGKKYELLSSLAHELGHCYEFMLNLDNKRVYPLYNTAEFSSLFLQRLFDDCMKKNGPYKESANYGDMMWQYVLYRRTMSNNINNQIYLNSGVEYVDYNTTAFVYFEDFNFSKYIPKGKEEEFIEYYPSLDNYLYVICDIMAVNFMKLYHDSPKDALCLFKTLITKPHTLKKVLEKYVLNLSNYDKVIKEASRYSQKILKK